MDKIALDGAGVPNLGRLRHSSPDSRHNCRRCWRSWVGGPVGAVVGGATGAVVTAPWSPFGGPCYHHRHHRCRWYDVYGHVHYRSCW